MGERPIRTEISFVKGLDRVTPVPAAAGSADLTHRFAVVQETFRPDCDGMYFDQELWRSLVDFARRFDPDAQTSVIGEGEKDEKSLEAFMARWDESTDPYPPPLIIVRDQRRISLLIATEYWAQVGGPRPYADSYTYSIFSREDVGGRVVDFLLDYDRGHRWDLITPAVNAGFWETCREDEPHNHWRPIALGALLLCLALWLAFR